MTALTVWKFPTARGAEQPAGTPTQLIQTNSGHHREENPREVVAA